MTKEKQYKEISKLFPSTLGVGDVVEFDIDDVTLHLKYFGGGLNQFSFWDIDSNQLTYLTYKEFQTVKLLRKNITAEDVLKMFQTVRKFHTTLELSNKGYLTYWESTTDVVKQEDWILGKPLYDQSEELIKLVREVLK